MSCVTLNDSWTHRQVERHFDNFQIHFAVTSAYGKIWLLSSQRLWKKKRETKRKEIESVEIKPFLSLQESLREISAMLH